MEHNLVDLPKKLEPIRPDDQRDKLYQFAVPLSRGMFHEANTFIKTKIVSAKENVSGILYRNVFFNP